MQVGGVVIDGTSDFFKNPYYFYCSSMRLIKRNRMTILHSSFDLIFKEKIVKNLQGTP